MGKSKYNNKTVWYDGIKFDSQKERDYYIILKEKEAKGEINNLRLQVPYTVIPKVEGEKVVIKHLKRGDKAVIVKYVKQLATKYLADFVYTDPVTSLDIVIDVKSRITRKKESYRLKKKLMLAYLGIEVQEVIL